MNKNNIVDEHPNDSKSVLNHIPATAQTVLLKIFARKNWGSKYQKTIFIVSIPLETETTMWASKLSVVYKIGKQRTQYTKQRVNSKLWYVINCYACVKFTLFGSTTGEFLLNCPKMVKDIWSNPSVNCTKSRLHRVTNKKVKNSNPLLSSSEPQTDVSYMYVCYKLNTIQCAISYVWYYKHCVPEW